MRRTVLAVVLLLLLCSVQAQRDLAYLQPSSATLREHSLVRPYLGASSVSFSLCLCHVASGDTRPAWATGQCAL